VIDIVEILQHWHAGRPKAVVARSVGVDRSTVDKYVAPALSAGLSPGGPALSRAEWSELVRGWFPELVEPRHRSLTFAVIHEHHDRIKEMLSTNTATTVHQRLRDEHGLTVGISSFRRYLWLEFPDEVTADKVTVPRPEVDPGEEAQIDYGSLGMWLDPLSGRRRRVWAFVMVLAASRHMFVRPVLAMDQRSFVAAHVAAFEFFGGTPSRLVPDNPKTAVERPDLYDPKINRAYAEMASYYGCLVDPARAGKPKDKPKVERPMPYVRDSFWRGREWVDEAQMQTCAVQWCTEVAGARHHRSLEGASPLSVFAAVEADALRGLPLQAFELASWSSPKVGTDCHAKVGRTLYSVPWRYIGRNLDARQGERTVEFFVDGVVVKTWSRSEKGKRTDYADFPPEKVAFFMRTPVWCRRRAAELGPFVQELVAILLRDNALYHLRAAQGVVGLGDKHSTERLDAACRRAIAVGDPSYRTVKGILLAGTEREGLREPSVPDAPAHLHGPERLFSHLGEEALS
jgi:Integrase core domain